MHELAEISRFCPIAARDYYRFDPLLHLRLDRDVARNDEIRAERLLPEEVVSIEGADAERIAALHRGCSDGTLAWPETEEVCQFGLDRLFHCGAGEGSFTVGPDGFFEAPGSPALD